MNRWLRFVCSVLAVAGTCLPAMAADAPTPSGPKAGSVTALLPTAHLSRVVNKANVSKDAAKGDDVYWQDVIRTEKGGRARITLTDQSILSVGSQAELHIIKHDAKTQQTELELTYGKIRAEVTTVTKDGGGFEVKTPTAVAGVIGTVFGTDSSPIETKFLCVSGLVTIRSADPSISGTTSCEAGKVVIVGHSKVPVKRNATPEEYQKWFADTEPATITGMYPWASPPGTTITAKASGIRLDGITRVTSPDPLVVPTMLGPSTTTTANLKIAVAETAKQGAYALTFIKSDGSQSTAIFLVQGAPGEMDDIGSMLNSYLDTLDEQEHAAVGAINAVNLQVQQAADIANGQLATANANAKPAQDLTKAGSDIQNQAGSLATSISNSAAQATAAGEAAKKDFTNRFNTAVTALNTRSPGGKPDDQFRSAITAAFSDVQTTLTTSVSALIDTLNTEAQTLEAAITSLETAEMASITAATPGGSLPSQTVEQGFAANFVASGALATGGPLSWSVCDASYKPTSLGVPIPASTPGCTPLPGYTSATAALAVNSCDLKPAIYPVRLTNGNTAWETTLRVIAPAYDDPITRLDGLALAYSARTPDIFMEYFDPVNFPGYSELQENIRRTMEQLSSMNIHIIVDDISINCNEATVRAEWQENYSFLVAPDHIQHLNPQQMVVKFLRTPGKGWYITELNGDNGTVQGLPPGPILTDAPSAQLSVLNVNVVTVTTTGAEVRNASTASSTPIVPLGPVTFRASISNTGTADVTLPLAVQFFLLDSKGNQIQTVTNTLPPPLRAGKQGSVDGTLTIPTSTPGGTLLKVGVRVNPGCVIPAQYCDASNLTTVQVQVGAVDLKVASIGAAAPLIGTLPGNVKVQIDNVGKQASVASTGNLLLTSPLFGGSIKADIPSIAAGGSATVTIPVPALPNVSGSENFTATINPAPTGDIDTKDKTLTAALTVGTAVDIQVAGITPTALLVGTTTATFNVQLNNLGGATSTATSADLALSDTTGAPIALGTANIPAIGPGGSATVPVTVTMPNVSGSNKFTAAITTPVKYDTDAANDSLTVTLPVTVGVDIAVTNIGNTTRLVEGQPEVMTVLLYNSGAATSTATTNNLILTGASGPALGTANIPAIGPDSSVTVPISITLPVLTGSTTFTATISPAVPNDLNSANNSLTKTFSIAPAVDIQVVSIAGSGTLIEGQAGTINVTLKNDGVETSSATTGNLTLSGPSGALATANIPAIPAGGTAVVPFTATMPVLVGATNFTATISPAVPLDLNPSNDTLTQSLTLATAVDIQVVSITDSSTLVEKTPTTFNITLKNNGLVASNATTNNDLIISGPGGPLGTANIPSIGAGASVSVPITVTVPALSGATTFTATINPAVPLDLNPSNDTLSASFNISTTFVDLKMTAFNMRVTSGLLSGSTYGFAVTVQNNGNIASAATDTLSCVATGPNFSGSVSLPLTTTTIGSIAPGTSTNLGDSLVLPKDLAGADTFTCTAGGDPNESSGTLGDNSLSRAVSVSYNLNLHFTGTISAPPALQMSSTSNMTVTVTNDGPDDAPANFTLQPAMNGANAGAATAGAALASGASKAFTVPFTVPQIGVAPQDVGGISGGVTIVDGTGLTETNSGDNTITGANFRLLDFAITTPTSNIVAVQGRSITTNAYTITPSTYLGLFPGMTISTGGTVPTGITIAKSGAVSGTVTISPGNYGSNYSGVSNGVTHGSSGNTIFNVVAEINLLQATIPSVLQDGSATALTGTINGGVPNITVTLGSTLPTGLTVTGTSPVTVGDGGTVSYNVSATTAAPLGAGSFNLTATDAGISNTLETVPAGNVTVPAKYTIGGQPNFVVGSAVFVNHGSGPYNGASALQYGEAAQMQVVVKNTGDANPAPGSTVTVTMSCNGSCTVVGSATGPAPTTAAPTTLTFSVGKVVDNPGLGYNGTATITSTSPELRTTDNSANLTWDVVDFNVVEGAGWPTTQNMQLGKTSQINFNVTEAGGSAVFSVPITVTATQSGVTLPAKNSFTPGTSDYTAMITVGGGVAQVGDNIVFTGTNYGVTRSFTQPVQYYTASIISTTLFVNSLTQPLALPLNNSTGETLELQMKGTFVSPGGSSGATITAGNANAPIITFTVGVTSAMAGDTFGAQAYDPSTTALPSPKALTVTAAIPATIPQDNIVYDLYVSTVGTANLGLTIAPSSGVSITPKQPWLSGETLNFDVTVTNNGTAASKGGEELDIFFLNSTTGTTQIASTTVPSALAANGGTTTFTMSLTAPDGNLSLQSSLQGTVFQDPPNNAKGQFNLGALDTSDWSIVLAAPGNTNANPAIFTYNPASAGGYTINVGYILTINNYAGAVFRTTPTVVKGIVDPSLTASVSQTGTSGAMTEVVKNLSATVAGIYIGQLTSNIGSVTRQATVYGELTVGSGQQSVTLVSTANNVAPVGGPSGPPTSVVINGYVIETIGLTGNRATGPNCAPAQTECDFTMTLTPDQTATGTGANGEGSSNLAYGTSTNFSFTGTLNPASFTLTPGNGTVTASITSAQVNGTKKVNPMSTYPDPIGSQQWDIAFIVNDLDVTFPLCVSVPPGTNAVVPMTWSPIGSFNAPTVSYAWVDGNLNPVPSSEISPNAGTVSPTGTLNFTVKNSATGTLPAGTTYYLQLTLYNSQGQPGPAPKYFAVGFDLTAGGGYCGASSPTFPTHGTHRAGVSQTTTQNPPVRLAGVYGREHIGALAAKTGKVALPDVQLASNSVSFTPSLPKTGDTVEVRFRMNNAGKVDASNVPMAFVVNGTTVVSDTFDVKAGASSLGALHWKIGDPAPKPATSGQTVAQIAVDPQHTVPQQSTLNKTEALSHFNLQGAGSAAAIAAATTGKSAHLEVAESGCLGFRFASGAGSGCGSADLELSVEDLANGKYVLNGRNGVADLGVGTTDASNASYGSQALVVVGHTYAVQLPNKNVGLFTVQRVRNPKQLSEKSDRLFNHTNPVKLGKSNGAAQTGDVSGGAAKHSDAFVYFDVTYTTQPGL